MDHCITLRPIIEKVWEKKGKPFVALSISKKILTRFPGINYGIEWRNLGFLYILEQLFIGYMRRSKSKSEHQMVSLKVSEVILGSSKGAHYPLPFLAYILTNLKSG